MTRAEKEKLVADLTTEFSEAAGIIACGYETMTVSELEAFRKIARDSEVKVRVIKNSLSEMAAKNAGKDGMELSQMNLFVWGDDVINMAKVVFKYAKENPKLVVKTGYIDGVVDAKEIEKYSKLLSRDEMLAMLLSTWIAPVRNITVAIDAIRQKKEEEQ